MTEVCFISSLARSCVRVPAVWVPTPLRLSFRTSSTLNVSRSARYWVQCSVLVYDVLCCCCCCFCCVIAVVAAAAQPFWKTAEFNVGPSISLTSDTAWTLSHINDPFTLFYFIYFFQFGRKDGVTDQSSAAPSNTVTVSMRAQSLERIIQSLARKKNDAEIFIRFSSVKWNHGRLLKLNTDTWLFKVFHFSTSPNHDMLNSCWKTLSDTIKVWTMLGLNSVKNHVSCLRTRWFGSLHLSFFWLSSKIYLRKKELPNRWVALFKQGPSGTQSFHWKQIFLFCFDHNVSLHGANTGCSFDPR